MLVIFRLAGVDGEATEDRIETLSSNTEPSSEKEIEKKYSLASIIGEVNGFAILMTILSKLDHIQENKDLVTWVLQLLSISIKLKKNRQQLSMTSRSLSVISRKLFQSVGMHSKFDGRNEMSMFDVILNILESVIVESHQLADEDVMMNQDGDKTDETIAQVEIFLELISDACKEMVA